MILLVPYAHTHTHTIFKDARRKEIFGSSDSANEHKPVDVSQYLGNNQLASNFLLG